MCFSAPASFIAAGGLTTLGAVSLVVAKKEDKILAAIPFLFGLQQAIEGVQWLYLNSHSYSTLAAKGFLLFAFIVWPVYVPSFVFLLDTKRHKLLKWFLFLGIAVAIYFTGLLLTQSISVTKYSGCVYYEYSLPLKNLVIGLYLTAVFGPLLTSSHKIFKVFGICSFILALVSWIFFTTIFVSVWCFFAAIVSAMFFVYILKKKKTKPAVY